MSSFRRSVFVAASSKGTSRGVSEPLELPGSWFFSMKPAFAKSRAAGDFLEQFEAIGSWSKKERGRDLGRRGKLVSCLLSPNCFILIENLGDVALLHQWKLPTLGGG